MPAIESKTIVFITGAFISNDCWNEWRSYFEMKGYYTIAPPWPGKNAAPAILRNRHPDPVLAAVTLTDVLAYFMSIVTQMPEKPIVIGHSYGGLLAQILLNKGLAAAAIAIHSVPPAGVIPYEWRFIKSNFKSLGYFTSADKTYLMTFRKWQDVFTNGMTLDQQKNGYYDFVIPESKRAIRGASGEAAKLDFTKEHHPLLLLAGSRDHCIPASIVQRTYRKYKSRYSILDFVVKDRNHFVLGAPTWNEDADYITNWLNKH